MERFPPKEDDRILLRKNWTQLLLEKIEILKSSKFKNQEEFNSWHQSSCCQLIRANDNYELTQGQAQKWINMSLKYLFVMGDERVSLISTNYQYFHIPIDNVIMNKLAEHGLAKFEEVWSKIADYDSYHNYQKMARQLDIFEGKIPMDVEFLLFNDRN